MADTDLYWEDRSLGSNPDPGKVAVEVGDLLEGVFQSNVQIEVTSITTFSSPNDPTDNWVKMTAKWHQTFGGHTAGDPCLFDNFAETFFQEHAPTSDDLLMLSHVSDGRPYDIYPPPPIVTNPEQSEEITTSTLSATWTASAPGTDNGWAAVDHYGIVLTLLSPFGQTVINPATSPNLFTGLLESKTYAFGVDAYSSQGRFRNDGVSFTTADDLISPPGKATTPVPTDDQEDLEITGKDNLKQLTWVTPVGETPDFLVYFRAQGGAWVLQETITDDSTSHTLSTTVLDAFSYYSIYEWRVDTRNDAGTTTGDTWTFITIPSPQFTDYTRKSDYNADQVWQPGTGWVDPNTFEFAGGGSYKERIVVVGHQVIYFGDL